MYLKTSSVILCEYFIPNETVILNPITKPIIIATNKLPFGTANPA